MNDNNAPPNNNEMSYDQNSVEEARTNSHFDQDQDSDDKGHVSISTNASKTHSDSKFLNLGLSPKMIANLMAMGFKEPTPIQEEAIPQLLTSKEDFIGLASTGTGKTGAFGIPLVENLVASQKRPQALVLCPTRELALQVADQLSLLGKHIALKVASIYGGASYRTQMDAVKRGAQVIVATPGRLVDFLEQKLINLSEVHTLILDEADEMISMGFQDDLEFILQATHAASNEKTIRASCKTWLFSATMSQTIRKIADRYLEKPKLIQINKNQGLASTVEQVYYLTKEANKLEVLSRILQINKDFYGIIFCQTKQQVADIDDLLRRRGFEVDCLHGDKTQKDREVTLRKFKSRITKVIVATDVAARGLDIKDLTHVINFSLPWDVESYIHRSGRTGRNNQKGVAISLVSPAEMGKLTKIQRVTRIPMKREAIPTAEQVALTQIHALEKGLFTIEADDRLLKKARTLLLDVADQESGMYLLDSVELFARMLVVYHPEIFTQSEHNLEYIAREEFSRRPHESRRGSSGDRDRDGSRRLRGGSSYEASSRRPRAATYSSQDSRPPRRSSGSLSSGNGTGKSVTSKRRSY